MEPGGSDARSTSRPRAPAGVVRDIGSLGVHWPSMTETNWYTVAYSSTTMSFDTQVLFAPTTPLKSLRNRSAVVSTCRMSTRSTYCRIRSTIMRFSACSFELPSISYASFRVKSDFLTVPLMGRNWQWPVLSQLRKRSGLEEIVVSDWGTEGYGFTDLLPTTVTPFKRRKVPNGAGFTMFGVVSN